MPTEFKVLKAEHGDCILIKTQNLKGDNFIILIDGGTSTTYTNVLKKELQPFDRIDLLVLTHIDSDHIQGIIKFIESPLFENIEIKKYWVNSKNIPFLIKGEQISYSQGITLEKLLIDKQEPVCKWNETIITERKITLDEGIIAETISPTENILESLYNKWPDLPNEYYSKIENVPISGASPTQISKGSLQELAKTPFKPDKTPINDIFNASSIAFVLKTPDINLLLLGDARPEIYISGLRFHGYNEQNKLKVDFVKVSHHGSFNNTSVELLDIIDCENYIISTNGGQAGHRLPDRETIAKIIYNPERVKECFAKTRTIYFNYPLEDIEAKAGKFIEEEDYKNGNWQIFENTTTFN